MASSQQQTPLLAVPDQSSSVWRNPDETFAYDLVATQQFIDPRRLGQANSGLNDEDLADIFCILHPASLPAHKAAAHIRELTPEHTISTQNGVKIRERKSDTANDPETFELAAQGLTTCDIVLRLSANLKDFPGSYKFGRNKQRCDFVFGRDDEVKRISNVHFKIYINEYGTIMLEDMSTNGTAVDGTLLRAKDKENGRDYRHTLGQGSIIVLTMTPPEEDFRFIVRIPQRDDESEIAYRQNLTNYFHRIHNANQERQRRGPGLGAHEPVSHRIRCLILTLALTSDRSISSRLQMLTLQIHRFQMSVGMSKNGAAAPSTTRLELLAKVLLRQCTR